MWIIKYILYFIFIITTAAFGSSDAPYEWLIAQRLLPNSFDFQKIQIVCMLLNLGGSILLLELPLSYSERKHKTKNEQITGYQSAVKELFLTALRETAHNNGLDCNLRIFVPQYTYFEAFLYKLPIRNQERRFAIKNITPLAEKDITRNLVLTVFPEPQGMVGRCYTHKQIIADFNLNNADSKDWNLSANQIQQTSELAWSVCVPIFSSQNTVIAILAVDGNTPITNQTAKRKIQRLAKLCADHLYNAAPQLFRPIRLWKKKK